MFFEFDLASRVVHTSWWKEGNVDIERVRGRVWVWVVVVEVEDMVAVVLGFVVKVIGVLWRDVGVCLTFEGEGR